MISNLAQVFREGVFAQANVETDSAHYDIATHLGRGLFAVEAGETAASRLHTATAAKDTSTSVREIRLEETRITINIRSPEI